MSRKKSNTLLSIIPPKNKLRTPKSKRKIQPNRFKKQKRKKNVVKAPSPTLPKSKDPTNKPKRRHKGYQEDLKAVVKRKIRKDGEDTIVAGM